MEIGRHWILATAPDHGENQRENDNGHSHEENDHAWVDIAFALRTAREGAEDGCHNHQEGQEGQLHPIVGCAIVGPGEEMHNHKEEHGQKQGKVQVR